MMIPFHLKHGDAEQLFLEMGIHTALTIINISSEEVKICLGDKGKLEYIEVIISAYSSYKRSKAAFQNQRIMMRVEGVDNRKHIVRVEY